MYFRSTVSVVFQSEEKNQRKLVWMFWLWENWGESKIWKRGRGGKEALADKPLDFENPVGQQTWFVIG